jgi:hypothetical protein
MMVAFYDIAQCSLVELIDVSAVLSASIITDINQYVVGLNTSHGKGVLLDCSSNR